LPGLKFAKEQGSAKMTTEKNETGQRIKTRPLRYLQSSV